MTILEIGISFPTGMMTEQPVHRCNIYSEYPRIWAPPFKYKTCHPHCLLLSQSHSEWTVQVWCLHPQKNIVPLPSVRWDHIVQWGHQVPASRVSPQGSLSYLHILSWAHYQLVHSPLLLNPRKCTSDFLLIPVINQRQGHIMPSVHHCIDITSLHK